MKFSELDSRMRVYETAHDHCALPGIYLVARIDGRSFTRLTKEVHSFDAPYDERFRELMVETVEHVMQCGFNVVFGHTQSDEISLLFQLRESAFGRKLRKFNSVLAGEASAKFSLGLGAIAAFDCRVCQFPSRELVRDYFRWRHEDAHRNALNGHAYWMLRKEGLDAREATERLLGLSVAQKNEFLFQRGVNFNEIPNWQKRGIGLYWESYTKEGKDPRDESIVEVERRRIKRDMNLPMGTAFDTLIDEFLDGMA